MIRDAAVQLPEELTGLLTELARRLDGLAAEEPLAALQARADHRYVIDHVSRDAAGEVLAGEVPIE
ncbi:hypothetical protein [Streptomyces sp. NPDC054849]